MKSQPIPNTSFCSIAQFPVLMSSFVFTELKSVVKG